MKGRIVWVFWLVVVLAVLTSTASYAWVAMNVSTRVRGIEVEALSDSVFLEISADADSGYDKNVTFDRIMYLDDNHDMRLSFVTYGRISAQGAIRVTPYIITKSNASSFSHGGKYDGNGRFFKAVKSDITGDYDSFVDITETLTVGQSLIGYYGITRGSWYTVSNTNVYEYYYEHVRGNGTVDYICIGKVPEGERLANRMFWGYANSTELDESQGSNVINIVSLDVPPAKYALHERIHLRCAEGTVDAKNLSISSVKVEGYKNYLTDTIRIMFIAKTENGETVTRFYSHRNPDSIDGFLFSDIEGNMGEVVTVDMYVFFDGTDEDAYDQGGILTRNDVVVKFAVDGHDYN